MKIYIIEWYLWKNFCVFFLAVVTSEICEVLFLFEKVKSYIPILNEFPHFLHIFISTQQWKVLTYYEENFLCVKQQL